MKTCNKRMEYKLMYQIDGHRYFNDESIMWCGQYGMGEVLKKSKRDDIISVVGICSTRRFKRTTCNWREIDANDNFID